ncbi:putative virion structural protein [Salmonella phage SPFM8]|nr:putative virion structural protein [Salmonella phage SPFM8]
MNPFKESTRFLAQYVGTDARPSMLTSELTEEAIAQIKRDPWIEQHAGHFQKPIPDFTISDLTPGRLASAWDGWIMYDWLEELRYYYNEVQVDVVVIPHILTFNLWPYADLDDEERHAF